MKPAWAANRWTKSGGMWKSLESLSRKTGSIPWIPPGMVVFDVSLVS